MFGEDVVGCFGMDGGSRGLFLVLGGKGQICRMTFQRLGSKGVLRDLRNRYVGAAIEHGCEEGYMEVVQGRCSSCFLFLQVDV